MEKFIMFVLIIVGLMLLVFTISGQFIKAKLGDGGEDQIPDDATPGTQTQPKTQKITYTRCGVNYKAIVENPLGKPSRLVNFELVDNGKIYGTTSLRLPEQSIFDLGTSGDLTVIYEIKPTDFSCEEGLRPCLKTVKGTIDFGKLPSLDLKDPLSGLQIASSSRVKEGDIASPGYLGDLTSWSYFASLYEQDTKTGAKYLRTTLRGTFTPSCSEG